MNSRLVISDKELESVSRLRASERYSYFVKRVADWEQVWGLWDEGWALVGDGASRTSFPLWPAQEFAEAYATNEWKRYAATEIGLDDLLSELLVKLADDNVDVAVFPTVGDVGMLISPARLGGSLREESERYG